MTENFVDKLEVSQEERGRGWNAEWLGMIWKTSEPRKTLKIMAEIQTEGEREAIVTTTWHVHFSVMKCRLTWVTTIKISYLTKVFFSFNSVVQTKEKMKFI